MLRCDPNFYTNFSHLDFAYDYRNRRVQKSVSTWNGSDFTTPTTTLFVYDSPLADVGGLNLLAELNTSQSALSTYIWGQDLSGSIDQAGGIGGLILLTFAGSPTTNCFVSYDGNGNLTALVDTSSLAPLAQYEYTPFGRVARQTGALALRNPFQFSTKFCDHETDLVYYGSRYYSPGTGRWIGRDPSDEGGGLNLYAFLKNCPTYLIDSDGRAVQDLQILANLGFVAGVADKLFNMYTFFALETHLPGLSFTPYDYSRYGNILQAMAVGMSIGIDANLGGRLLKNVGGPAGFSGLFVLGLNMSTLKANARMSKEQSLAAAVVSGRLEAVEYIGEAAGMVLSGEGPKPNSLLEQAAYGFFQSARRGDTPWADLDAAIFAGAVCKEQIDVTGVWGSINVLGMAVDMINGDAAGAFSRLPEYQALNAWDMATEMEDFVEGM